MKINKRLIATVLAIMLIVGIFAQTSFVAFATTEGENGGDPQKTIASIAELDASILSQTFELNSTETPVLPEKLTATIADATEDVAITWAADPAFNVTAVGTYTYTATLAEGYVLGADVTLPNITLVVVDNSTPLVPLENAEENSETEQGDGSGIMPMSGDVPVPASDTVKPVASYVGDTTKTLDAIYANGVPIIVESAGGNLTQIRYDIDGNGEIGDDEIFDMKEQGADKPSVKSADLSDVIVYGGSNVDSEDYINDQVWETGSTSVTMTGGVVEAIYGGGYTEGDGTSRSKVNGNTKVEIIGGTIGTLYGGGYTSVVTGNTNVTMTGGIVVDAVFGGGYEDEVLRDTQVKITGGAVGYLVQQPAGFYENYRACVFGGGHGSEISGSTNVTIGSAGGANTAPMIANNVYGGGLFGSVYMNATVTMYSGTVGTLTPKYPLEDTDSVYSSFTKYGSDYAFSGVGNVFGGGHESGVGVDTTVTIHGGQIGPNGSAVDLTGKSIYTPIVGNVFGGGAGGTVYGTGNVTINGGNIGGLDLNMDAQYMSAHVGNVYGGGWEAPVSNTNVIINAGANIQKSSVTGALLSLTGNVYGSGLGESGEEVSEGGGELLRAEVYYEPNNYTTAVYHIGGTVAGDLYSSGSPIIDNSLQRSAGFPRPYEQPIIAYSTFVFLNDTANLGGHVYKNEYLNDEVGENASDYFETTMVVENTSKKVISSLEENNDSTTEEQYNASVKVAVDNSSTTDSSGDVNIDYVYFTSSLIDTDVAHVLRLQNNFTDVDGDNKKTHWTLVGHVDLEYYTLAEDNIAFANNQELYIYGYHLLNAPAFVATAATNGGYIITEKDDIANTDYFPDTESDIQAHIYRGYFTGELDVSGGNTYVLNASPVTNLTANPSIDLQDFLGIKFAGSNGLYYWGVLIDNDYTEGDTEQATVTPAVDKVGTFTQIAYEDFEHKFDSVYLVDKIITEPKEPVFEAVRGMPVLEPRLNIDLSGWADGQTDVIVVDTETTLVPVEFKKEPIDDDSAPIHETNTTVGGKINPPTDEEIEEIPFKPDAWTTTPNDESTKWEFDTKVVPDGTTEIILYPYYEQWTVIFEDDNFSDSTIHHVEKVDKDGKTVSKPTTDPTSSGKNFVGWYTDETLTTEYNFNTLVTGNMTLYPKFENISTGGGDPDPEEHKPEEEEVEEWTVTFEDENFNDNKTHDEETVTDGETVDPPSKDPVSEDEDKKFVGWYEDEDLTIPYEFKDPVTEDITLYPKFEDKDTVSVTYEKDEDGTDDTKTDIITGLEPGTNITVDNNGGTNPGFEGDVTVDQDITVPNPTKPGNIFTGYEKEVDPETGDITITATWKPDDSFTVTFEDNNFDDDKIHHEEDVPSGEKVKEPSTPTPPSDDEKFVGWFEDEDFNEYYVFDDPVTEDITLYPKFEDKDTVSVTYEKDQDGTDDTKTDIITGLEPGTNITVDNNGGTNPGFDGDITINVDTIIPDPTKEGSIFTGYEKDVDEDGNITITATWKDTVDVTFNEYTDGSANTQPGGITGLPIGTVITVDNAGGTNPGFDGDITINVDTIIPDPTREGYIFTGYVESEDGNGKIIITATWLSEEETPFQPELPPVEGLDVLETPDGPIYVHPDGTPLTYEELVDIFGEDIPLGALEGLGLDEFGMPLGGLDLDGFNPTGSLPQTGDESKLLLYFFSGSMMLLAGVVVNTTRKTKE